MLLKFDLYVEGIVDGLHSLEIWLFGGCFDVLHVVAFPEGIRKLVLLTSSRALECIYKGVL